MTKYNTELWVANLDSIYKQALNAKPIKPFFLAIYDYADYVLKTDTLAQLSKVFTIHKKSDYETLDQYKKELIDYINALIPKLEAYKTDDFEDKENINEILSIKNGSTQVLGDPEGWISIFGNVEEMSYNAYKNDNVKTELLNLIGVTKNDGKKTVKWEAQDVKEKYDIELEKIKRLKETRGWYAWENMVLFYEVFNDYEGLKKDLNSRNRWFEGMSATYLAEEIKAILKDTTYDQMQIFLYGNFITYLHKAHRQLINEIAQFAEISKTEKPKASIKKIANQIPFVFDDQTVTLEINGKSTRFKKDTRKLTLFKLLVRKTKGIYYNEAVEELEGAVTDETTAIKNIYYEACRGIQISLGKIGITDFLQFDYNQARINPLYKRASKTN